MNNNPYRYEPLYTPGTYTSNVIDSASGEFDIKAPEHKLQEPTSFEPTMLEPTNNAFIPIVDDGEDSSFTRIKGLQAYVTADMKQESQREAKRIFGNIPKYAHDHYSNMYVGRAIASAAGVADTPELLFKNPAYAAQGYKMPNAWSDRNQLYAAIGSQFATMEREKMQSTLTEEQAILKEREKDPKALSQAILNAVTRSSVSPSDRVLLEYNGITPQTIQKVHAALVLFGQQADNATRHTKTKGTTFAEDKSAEQTAESDIDSSLITGGRDGWFGENLVNPYSAYNVADLMGDDKMARGLFLELVAMAGRNKRSQEQGREWSTAGKTLLNETVARLGYALDEWFMTKPDVPAGADADIINDRRNAMLADIRKYYEAGYADTDDRIGFSLARVPVSVARVAGGTIGYLHPAGWIAEASDMGQKYIDEAAANIYETDPTNMEASWWERKGAPGAKTAVFTGAIAATGGVAKWVGGAITSRFAPNLAKRVAGSKALTYGTRVVEGTTTEALEELNNAIGQELLEGANLIADRQKQENMTQLWKTWTSPEFWSANVGMNLVFGLTGYKGSRSKVPYKSVESLVKLGFSKNEAQSVTDRIQTAIGEGQSQAEVGAILAEEIRKKSLENPQATGKKMIQAALDMFRRREIEDSAANGVREALLKEANVTDYTKDEDGNYTLKAVKHGADGKFESVEMKLSEDELNNWLTTEAATHITQEILRVQALVRGEQAATAAAKLIAKGKSPFERVAYLTDAPVEVLAKLKGKDTFDAETIAAFTKYAVDEINRRMAGGETREQAESAEFGTTGASLGAISRLSDQYSEREGIEVHSGNIEEGALTESAAFILPGKSVGDNILMLARGQVTASEVAHDWLEGFARSRFYSDRELWSNRLDALDRELLQRGIIPKSLFKSPEGSRKDIEYIEALNHLTEQRWLVDHEAFNMTDASNALLSEMLEELSAVQNGLALAGELKNWMDSEEGKQALADKGALHKLFAEAGSSLADLMAEAEQVAPKTAADFVLKHRERMLRELDELANLVESPQAEAPPPTESDVTLPNGETVTAAEIASVNGIDSTTGELSTPPLTAYTSVKAPKGAGLGLNGGIAHRMRDGSVEGASKLSTLNLHSSVADADLAKANGSIADPVIVYRHRDGKMEVIGGFARYHHDKSLGVENTHVKVFGAGKKHPANWAADKARANKIKEGIASVADIIRHMQKHGYTRNAARKLNLIPKLTTGEHPASRAAWLLMQHATKKELKNLLAGHITTREALATIADKVDTLDLEQQGQATASFSIRTKGKRKYSTLDQLHNNELLRMFLDEALQLQQESIRFLDRDSNINDVTRTAAEIRGLLSAMYKVIPKEARPWKTLKDLPDRVRTLSYAALNPHEQLDVQDAPGMHPDEVIRYNQLTVDQRMLDIASKLARASTALIRAMARSTEAYLCRAEIERADKAIRALEPKLQKSGKERRGLTSEIVYKKAHQWYTMMDWSDQRIQEEAQKAMAVKAKPEATQDDIDNAERTLKAILLFGGLRRENLERTRTGVQFLLDFISTGRATWEAKLTAERRAIEAPQIALANLLPKVDQSYLNNKDRKASLVGKAMEGNMNITQLLDAGSAMQGPIGKFFADWRDEMALALDAANYDIQQEQRNLEKVLSEILQKHGKKGNDIDRSQFIADCQQVHNTGAVRKGVIKVTRYEFEAKDIEDFAKIREEQGEEAFKAAVHTRYKSANTKEDLRKDEMPYEAAWQDALSQAQSPYYRGGKIYVDHYGPRDTDHVAPLELTRMQAANLVMMADQPSYANQYDDDGKLIKRGTMDINGYTEDVIARLEAYAGRDLMALARYMRDTYNHTGLFAAYAEYMGLPFPAEENYWPGMFDQPTSGQMVDALDASRSGNGVFDMLIKRREHISPPDIKLGLYDVWSNTIQQHYNYVHLSPLTRKLRRFLRDRDSYARMCEAVGKSAVDNLIALLDTVDGAAGLQLRAQHAWNKLLGWYQGKQALLLLSGATSSAIKQTTGILNALAADGITPLNLIPYIMKSAGFGHKTPADMMKLKVFQNRIDRDSLTNRAFRLEPDQKMGKWGLDMGTVLGMRWFMERPDAWVNSISMAAVYNQTYDSLANAIKATEGHSGTLSPEEIAEIEKQCEAKVSQVMHRAAQPMEKTDKGAVMQQNNAAVSHIFYMAGESLVKIGLVMNRVRKEQAKHASESHAVRKMQFLRSAFTAWRTILPFSCANQLILTLLAAANGSMPDDDEERVQWLTSQAVAAISGFGMLNIVPVLGDIVSAAGQWAFGSYGAFATFGDSGVGIDPRIFKHMDDAIEKEGWERIYAIANLTRSIGTVAGMGAAKGITGMATGYAILSGIGTLFNTTRPIIQRFRNNERDEKKKSKKKAPLVIPT